MDLIISSSDPSSFFLFFSLDALWQKSCHDNPSHWNTEYAMILIIIIDNFSGATASKLASCRSAHRSSPTPVPAPWSTWRSTTSAESPARTIRMPAIRSTSAGTKAASPCRRGWGCKGRKRPKRGADWKPPRTARGLTPSRWSLRWRPRLPIATAITALRAGSRSSSLPEPRRSRKLRQRWRRQLQLRSRGRLPQDGSRSPRLDPKGGEDKRSGKRAKTCRKPLRERARKVRFIIHFGTERKRGGKEEKWGRWWCLLACFFPPSMSVFFTQSLEFFFLFPPLTRSFDARKTRRTFARPLNLTSCLVWWTFVFTLF